MVAVTDPGRSCFWKLIGWIGWIFSFLIELADIAIGALLTLIGAIIFLILMITSCPCKPDMEIHCHNMYAKEDWISFVRNSFLLFVCGTTMGILSVVITMEEQFLNTRFKTRRELECSNPSSIRPGFRHPYLIMLVCLSGLGCPVVGFRSMDNWRHEDIFKKMAELYLDWLMVAIYVVLWMVLGMSSQERSRKVDASSQVATEDYNVG